MKRPSSNPASPWRRVIATGLLCGAAAAWLASVLLAPSHFWARLIQATTEASLAGGLADWFAVTALFRRPLGLAIPHTAIIPASKARIAAGLAAFLEEHFLTPAIICAKLRSLDAGRRLGAWIALRENALKTARRIVTGAEDNLDMREFGALLSTRLGRRLVETDLRPLLNLAVDEMAAAGVYAKLLDEALAAVEQFLKRRATERDGRTSRKSRGWIRQTVNRQVTAAIIGALQDLVADLGTQESPTRATLLAFIHERASNLVASARMDTLQERLFRDAAVKDQLRALLSDAAGLLHDEEALANLLVAVGRGMQNDARLRDALSDALETVVVEILPLHEELTKLIEEVVRSWDAEEFARRIEAAVDADLQFIRINGTVVGAIVGCLLFVMKELV